jgi:uncharacterized protein (TIGR03067 family)
MRIASLCLLMMAMSLPALAGGGDSKEDPKAMHGTWKPTSAELAGKEFPDEVLKTMTLIVTKGKYKVIVGKAIDEGTFKLDPAKKPSTMDITSTKGPNKGKTFLTIYELSGDTLKVCYDLSGKERPGEFRTKPDTALFLVTYKRAKR